MGASLLLSLLALLLTLTPVVRGQYAQATITAAVRVSSTASASSPQFRSNPECAMDLVATSNPTLIAIGGYNVTGGGATIPYPSYAAADMWYSTNGFTSATYKAPVTFVNGTGSAEVGRIAGGAGLLANNVLLYFGGLIGEYGGYIYYSESTYYSTDLGTTWNLAVTGNASYTPPTTRYEFAYAVVPNTNTILIAGGSTYNNGVYNDVWASSDGYGRVWTQQNAGGAANPNVVPNEGGAMVALYDSPATIVWITPYLYYYKSTNLGQTWSTGYTAPWQVTGLSYATVARELPVLTADHDNYIYYGGGDSGAPQFDLWLSTDKATTWTQIALVNNAQTAGGLYAAAIGSCLAVRTVNGAKELDLYGGSIFIYQGRNTYNASSVYALQMSLAFQSTAFAQQQGPQASPPAVTQRRWYFYYAISGGSYSVCASGYLTTANTATLATIGTSNPTYVVWWITGTRVYTSGGVSTAQVIAGLAPLGADGASQEIFPNRAPYVDGGGITYLLASTGLGEAYNFVNVYANGSTIAEDGFTNAPLVTQNFTLSGNPIAAKCNVYGSAALNTGLVGAPIGYNTQTNTPQYRSNPECAMDLTATTNPTMFAIGGYNQTGLGATIPYPSYATSDIWSSTDGFTTSQWNAGQVSYPRLAAAAGYLANGNLVTWGGLGGEYNGTIYYDTSVTVSADRGTTWYRTFRDFTWNTAPVIARIESAYCAVPYTNTLVTAGGTSAIGVLNDVWISTDGQGYNWTLQYKPTGPGSRNPNNIQPHRGGAMVALYDSSYVSAQFPSPNSTLVLMLPSATYYKSFDLGRTWSTPYTAPWRPSGVPAQTYTRYLVSVTADRDNYLYFGGGDAGAENNDLWFSVDRAETWTQLALLNNIASVQYASAIGSCMGVRTVNGAKTLTVYGGNVWTRVVTNGVRSYTPNAYYALQFALTTTSPTPLAGTVTNVPSPFASRTWYWSYAFTSAAGAVCASGTVLTSTLGSVSTLTGSNVAYRVWFIQGTRVFTNATYAGSQIIAGLAPLEADGATNLIYPSQTPPVDGGGLTYYLAGTGFLDSANYINIYNGGAGIFDEDQQTVQVTVTQNLTFSQTPIAGSNCAQRIQGQATIATGLVGAPIGYNTQTNTPQYRSNPECAYDLTAIGRSNGTMTALGGYNVTFTTSTVPYPSYPQPDIWSSNDGFTSQTQFVVGQTNYAREGAMAAYVANGNLITWGGLGGEFNGFIYYDVSVTYSQDGGVSWNTSYSDPSYNTVPSVSRYEAAYCAVPFTNTIVHAGGQSAAGVLSDVWLSSDGTGATWIQMNPGGAATTVLPFFGGAMVALYDSQYVSFQFQTPNSTLVLVSNLPYYYKSYDLGATWTPGYSAPWDRTASSALYPTVQRSLPVLTADQDNYLYYGGGDITTQAPDFWFSVDKAESWSRLNLVNTLSATYAASIGGCLGVRTVNGQKQLDLYGGNLYVRNSTNQYSTTSYYSVQMNLQFGPPGSITTTRYPLQGSQPVTWYWSYAVNGGSFSVCASGTMLVSSTSTFSTFGTSNPAYLVWWMEGTRIFSNSTYTAAQIIAGLAQLNSDGSSNLLYTNAPYVDGGGITYLLGGYGLGDSNQFINIYNSGNGQITEDGFTGSQFVLTQNFTVSRSPPGPFAVNNCRLNAAGTIASATQGAAISQSTFTNVPQFRSNPECAYNLSSYNPTMFVIGGYNVTGGSYNVPYPSYAQKDMWYSNDGFQTATYSAGSTYSRLSGNFAYLANGNLVYWGGLNGEYGGYVYFDTTTTYSMDLGNTWYSSYTDAGWLTNPSQTRYESAYCAVPYTNMIVTAGGRTATSVGLANDVWYSSDGTGAIWIQTSNGNNSNVPLHYGSVMVALYDSQYVSSQYAGANSTLVLALGNLAMVFTSRDYGYTWQAASAPWGYGVTSYPTYARPLAVMTADHDNYLYYGGGDAGVAAPEMWLSVDKAQSWSRIALSNAVSRYIYASAIGSCLGVRVVGGVKQLALFGGNIVVLDTSTSNYTSTPVYALQINTQFINGNAFNQSAATQYPIATNRPTMYYFQYQLTSTSGYSICTSGSLSVSGNPTLATANSAAKAYVVYWAQGVRVYTQGSTIQSQIFTGLDYANTDGSSNLLYPTLNPPVDSGGLSFGLATTGLGESYNYVNVYSPYGAGSGRSIAEDSFIGNATVVSNFTLSIGKPTLSCPVYGVATIGQATAAAAISSTLTNTPQFRSNPECAYNLQQSSNQQMFAIGGYNQTGLGASIPYPAYARGDIWTSTNGFSSATASPGQANYARLAAAAGYLANGNLVTWGGLAGEFNGFTYFDTSVTYSTDMGNTWTTSYTDANWNTMPSVARYEMAYCAIPFTNTLVLAGGITATAAGPASDVWVSQDGTGAVWQQMNPGGVYNRVPPHSASVMAAFYDSSAVSSLFYSSNSTLLLILPSGAYYKSTSLGAYWSQPYAAPWQSFFSVFGVSRNLPVLTIDTDNYAYFGGGDIGAAASDFWLSVDKAETFTRMGVVNNFASSQLYVSAIGSCLGVQLVGGQKQLVLYGGNIYTTASGSNQFQTQYYSMQLNVAFQAAAPSAAQLSNGLTTNAAQIWYFQYTFSATSPSYSVCASGQIVTPGTPTLATQGAAAAAQAYEVWYIGGTRVFTNASGTVSQSIAGLGSNGLDGADQLLYPNVAAGTAPFSGGGVSYVINGPALGDANPFINLYSGSGGAVTEDGELGTVSNTIAFTLQKTPTAGCPFYGSATINSGIAANSVPTSGPSQRLDPECAFDTTNPNPLMFALGGSADGGATAGQDAFYSYDGFSATSGYIPSHNEGGRYNGGAGYLANGNIVWWGGLINNQGAATYYLASFYSSNFGANWTLTDNTIGPWARQLFAYCAVPYTNTLVMIGGIPYSTSAPSNDVWLSSDGIGKLWTQQTSASSNNSIAPFYGGQVVALFDSQYVSPSYVNSYSTLVLVANKAVYTSFNLGANWIVQQAPGAWSVSYQQTRSGVALAADRDNIVYLVGGDSYSSDIWMSADKGFTWRQLGVNVNSFASGSGNFAAAVGSCAAVRYVNGQKTLSIYGGDLFSYSNGAYQPLSQYSLQLPLTYATTAPTLYTSPAPAATATNAYFQYTLVSNVGSVCAYGQLSISSSTKLGILPAAYTIFSISGSRIFTPTSGSSTTQTITGLAAVGVDGADQALYTAAPYVSGGGITYLINGVMVGPGANGGPIADGRTFVNVYNNSGPVTEDWGSATAPNATGSGFQWSYTTQYSCAGYGNNGGGSSNSGSSGKSGLSGGAIAGIVIGSVVGACILIPICILLLLRGRRGGKQGAQQFQDRDGSEPSQMAPSNVEMQSADGHDSEHSIAPGETHAETEEV